MQHGLSAAIWALKEGCLSFVLVLAMADRVKTLTADRAKTAAISKYVKVFRDELLRDLPDASRVNKNIKRNELVRLGRARFSQEPASVQLQYYTASDIQALPALKRSLELGSVGDTEHKSSKKAAPPSSPHPSSGVRELIVDMIVEPPSSSGSAGVRESDVDMSSAGLDSSAPPSFRADPPQATLDSPRPRLKRSLASECLEEDPDTVFDKICLECGMSSKVGVPQSSTTSASTTPASSDSQSSASAGVRELSEGASSSGAATLASATAPARPRLSVPAAPSSRSRDELINELGGTLRKLQQWFGHSDGASVLAASYRLVPHALTVQAPRKVKAAAILSLAAKMNATVDNKDLRRIWRHVAGTRFTEKCKTVEQSIFNRFAVDGLDGPFANENMAMLDRGA